MQPFEVISFCPRCGERSQSAPAIPFHCALCGLKLFFNTTVSVSAFIFGPDGKVLLIQRGKEPAKGKLATVGGFVDIGETAEAALLRELREEVGAEVENIRFLTSATNNYLYADITYPVLDLFFICHLRANQVVHLSAEASALVWSELAEIDEETLAFDSMKIAFRKLVEFVESEK